MGVKLRSSTASYELRRHSTASLMLMRARGTRTTSGCVKPPKPGRGVGSADATHAAQLARCCAGRLVQPGLARACGGMDASGVGSGLGGARAV